MRVTKAVRLGGDRRSPTLGLTVTIENRSDVAVETRLGLEWTLTMLGGGGNPAAWFEAAGERTAHDAGGTVSGVDGFAQGNTWIGVTIDTTLSEPADLWWAPVETVSNSEAGFERSYQGAGILVGWPLALAAGQAKTVTVTHAVSTDRDRLAEETAAAASEPAAT